MKNDKRKNAKEDKKQKLETIDTNENSAKFQTKELIIEKSIPNVKELKQSAKEFMFCSNRHCENFACLRHNSQMPMGEMKWVENFHIMNKSKKDCEFFI